MTVAPTERARLRAIEAAPLHDGQDRSRRRVFTLAQSAFIIGAAIGLFVGILLERVL